MDPLTKDKFVKILIVSESINPYVGEIAGGLEEFFIVKRSVKDFLQKRGDFNIIHIQWPEELSSWTVPDDYQLKMVENALSFWKEKAKIVVTRHNVFPNKADPLKYMPLYDLVYFYADAVVHLGEYSLNEYAERYPKIYNRSYHKIIPHHIYESYPNTVSRTMARQYFHIDESKSVILCFGNIRSDDQFKMMFRGYRGLKVKGKCLFVPRYEVLGGLARRYILKRNRLRLMQWYYKVFFNLRLGSGFVTKDEVQYFFNAADVVFIPRIDQLNSGVVFLALAFNKIVVGPEIGNIGEMIKSFNNPVFNPKDDKSIIDALEQAVRMAQESKKTKNLQHPYYSLEASICKHLELYRELMR